MAIEKATREYETYKDQERTQVRLESIKELDQDLKRLNNKNK